MAVWLHPKENKKDVPTLILFPGHTHAANFLWNPAKEAHEMRMENDGYQSTRTRSTSQDAKVISYSHQLQEGGIFRIAGSDNSDHVALILENILLKKYPMGKKFGLGFRMGGLVIYSLGIKVFRMVLINYLAPKPIGISISS